MPCRDALLLQNQKRHGSGSKQRLFSFTGKKKSPAPQINKPTRRAGGRPGPLSPPSPAEESAEIPPGDLGPCFFSCFGKRLVCQALIQNRSAFRGILWRGWEAAHIPGKFSGRKSLWKRVGVYSTVSEAFQKHE